MLKKKNHILTSFKQTFKKPKILEKYKYFERVLPKKCCFDENKNNTFFDIFWLKCNFLLFYIWLLMTGFVQMGHILVYATYYILFGILPKPGSSYFL